MKIKMLVMDVDGTLTDGRVYMGAQGEVMKAFHVRDGYVIAHVLPELGITPVIITGRSSQIVERRAAELKIEHLYQGVTDKLGCLKQLAEERNVTPEQIAYIGDDLNDLECIRYCGYTGCPADSAKQVREAADYVCKQPGGNGAVREFIESML